MDDETAEIELVSQYPWFSFTPLTRSTAAPAEFEQNTSDIETDDLYVDFDHIQRRNRVSYLLAILDSFDGRLAKLEKSILPLYTASQILNRRRNSKSLPLHVISILVTVGLIDIGKTLSSLREMSFNKEDLAADEATILRGYVDRMSIAFHTNVSKPSARSAEYLPGYSRTTQCKHCFQCDECGCPSNSTH